MSIPGIERFFDPTEKDFWFSDDSQNQTDLAWLKEPLNEGITNNFPESEFGGESTCANPMNVFLGPDAAHNFWSCAFYPNFTRDFRDASGMSADHRSLVRDLGIRTEVDFATEVAKSLSAQLQNFCNLLFCNYSICSNESTTINTNTETLLSGRRVLACLHEICNSDPIDLYNVIPNPEKPNPDITGIGVVISYAVQYGISFASILFLALALISKTKKKHFGRTAVETLLTALDDFQRTQCCFVIALIVARLSAVNDMRHSDEVAAATASCVALVPTVIIMGLLMEFNQLEHSSFTFWLTVAAWILSISVNLNPRSGLSPADEKSYYLSPENMPSRDICANEKPSKVLELICWQAPSMFILTFRHIAAPNKAIAKWSRLVLAPLGRMLQPKLLPLKAGMKRRLLNITQYWHSILHLTAPAFESPPVDHVRKICHFFVRVLLLSCIFLSTILTALCIVAVVALCITVPVCLSIVSYTSINILKQLWKESSPATEQWEFGQVIALTVWLPTALSFFNDCVYGPLIGRSNQLPRQLRIVRSDDSNTRPVGDLPVASGTSSNDDLAEDGNGYWRKNYPLRLVVGIWRWYLGTLSYMWSIIKDS